MWPKIYESDLKVIAISGLNLEKRVIQVNGAFDLLPWFFYLQESEEGSR